MICRFTGLGIGHSFINSRLTFIRKEIRTCFAKERVPAANDVDNEDETAQVDIPPNPVPPLNDASDEESELEDEVAEALDNDESEDNSDSDDISVNESESDNSVESEDE
jgi:hypothetical protein